MQVFPILSGTMDFRNGRPATMIKLAELNYSNAPHTVINVRFVDVAWETMTRKCGSKKGTTFTRLSCLLVDQTGGSMLAQCFEEDAVRLQKLVVRQCRGFLV